MPANIVKSFAEKTGLSVAEVESAWDKAKQVAKDKGYSESDDNFYAYVTGILKKMLDIDESDTTSSFGFPDIWELIDDE